MLISGEPSGDLLGAQLMAGLKSIAGARVTFTGVGGPAMEAEGLRSLFSIDTTSVMGLRAIIPRIPAIFRNIRRASDFAMCTHPDALVCIDSPEFTHRVAKRVRRLDPAIPIVNYVAPQVWASREYRARWMTRYFDLVLALLPFEVPFFEAYGLHARFVGHPVVERVARIQGGEALRERLGIPERAPLLAILPGSRISEVRILLPIFLATMTAVKAVIPEVVCIMPAVPALAPIIREASEGWPTPLHIVEDEVDKFAAFDAADAALAASGTVTTELALAGVPMVVAYKVGLVTSAIARALIRVPYVTLVNLLLGRKAVPEFLQDRCRASLIADCLIHLLQDADFREQQIRDLEEAVHLLGVDDEPPSLRAARALLKFTIERSRPGDQRASIGT